MSERSEECKSNELHCFLGNKYLLLGTGERDHLEDLGQPVDVTHNFFLRERILPFCNRANFTKVNIMLRFATQGNTDHYVIQFEIVMKETRGMYIFHPLHRLISISTHYCLESCDSDFIYKTNWFSINIDVLHGDPNAKTMGSKPTHIEGTKNGCFRSQCLHRYSFLLHPISANISLYAICVHDPKPSPITLFSTGRSSNMFSLISGAGGRLEYGLVDSSIAIHTEDITHLKFLFIECEALLLQ